MSKMCQIHPLDLHEIRSRIARSLGFKDLASCARVSQDWNDSFTPPLYSTVVLSKQGPSMESLERNKHLIQRLRIQSFASLNLPSKSERDGVIRGIMAYSTLTTLDLGSNSIGSDGAVALSEAIKINSTLTTLNLYNNVIRDKGVVALYEALKVNSTMTLMGVFINDYPCLI
ncbi:hypothetical protein BGZ88_001037 [Linnemannia elongata]|nr:hypothetical protein BGZ88_001037 [Linnemannia elongata]